MGAKQSGRAVRVMAGVGVAAYCVVAAGPSCPTTLPAGCYLINTCTSLFYTANPPYCYCEICWDLWQFDPPNPQEPGAIWYNPQIGRKVCELRRSDLKPEGCVPFNPCQQGELISSWVSEGITAAFSNGEC